YMFGPIPSEVRARIVSSLERSDCTWLNLDALDRNWGTIRGKVSGFAGDVASVTSAAGAAARVPVVIDTAEVSSVGRQACGPLNAFRRFREASPSLLAEQRRFNINNDTSNCEPLNAMPRARIRVDVKLEDESVDFALLGFESNGEMQALLPSRAVFDKA